MNIELEFDTFLEQLDECHQEQFLIWCEENKGMLEALKLEEFKKEEALRLKEVERINHIRRSLGALVIKLAA